MGGEIEKKRGIKKGKNQDDLSFPKQMAFWVNALTQEGKRDQGDPDATKIAKWTLPRKMSQQALESK